MNFASWLGSRGLRPFDSAVMLSMLSETRPPMLTRATVTLMSPMQGENPNLGTFVFVALPRVGEIMALNPPELRVQLIEPKPTPASQTPPGQPSVPEVIV